MSDTNQPEESFTDRLRKLADWLDEMPELPDLFLSTTWRETVSFRCRDLDQLQHMADILGEVIPKVSDYSFVLTKAEPVHGFEISADLDRPKQEPPAFPAIRMRVRVPDEPVEVLHK